MPTIHVSTLPCWLAGGSVLTRMTPAGNVSFNSKPVAVKTCVLVLDRKRVSERAARKHPTVGHVAQHQLAKHSRASQIGNTAEPGQHRRGVWDAKVIALEVKHRQGKAGQGLWQSAIQLVTGDVESLQIREVCQLRRQAAAELVEAEVELPVDWPGCRAWVECCRRGGLSVPLHCRLGSAPAAQTAPRADQAARLSAHWQADAIARRARIGRSRQTRRTAYCSPANRRAAASQRRRCCCKTPPMPRTPL